MIKLEPSYLYDNAIVGELNNHFLYDYDLLISCLTKDFMNNNSNLSFDEAVIDAYEWYEFNIHRSLCYLNQNEKPIIIKKIDDIEESLNNDNEYEENEYIKFNDEFWVVL